MVSLKVSVSRPLLLALVLLSASLIPGCVGQTTYSLIWVHGEERLEPEQAQHESCSYLFDHEVGPDRQHLRYRSEAYEIDDADDLDRIIAFDYFREPSGCPVVYELRPDDAEATVRLGAYGTFNVSFEDSGTVNVDGQRSLDPGENVTLTYSQRADEGEDGQWRNGTIHVTVFEGWPRSGLVGEEI
jgi:hypothetical protein